MSQNSLVIPTTGTLSGVALVTAVNGGLDSLNTNNSGAGAPTAPEADQFWMDTVNNLMKQRDGGNANWYPQWVRGVPHGGGMRHSGESATLTSNTTLTVAQLGEVVLCNGTAPFTLTMPLSSAFPAGTGMVLANYGTQPVYLVGQGSDVLDQSPWLNVGDSLIAMSNSAGNWRLYLRANNGKASQSGAPTIVTATGYGSLFVGGTTVTFTYPYATGYLPQVTTNVSGTGAGGISAIVQSLSSTGFALSVIGTNSSGSVGVLWQAR